MKLNPEEQEVMDHIDKVHAEIRKLGLRSNKARLADHIHGLHAFVIMHALQREDEEQGVEDNAWSWPRWYEPAPTSEDPEVAQILHEKSEGIEPPLTTEKPDRSTEEVTINSE